jgi:hemerythrin-like metal-binding protein
MSNRVQWDPRYSVGNEVIDDQHRAILARCNALADCLADASEECDRQFQKIFDELKALAREHFATEEALLLRNAYPLIEEHRHEQEEFDYLESEIITTENFDKHELQSFLSLWWSGHIAGCAKNLRSCLEQQATS